MCVFANLGGDNGMRLQRAAFSVLLKFTDAIDSFQALIEEIDVIMASLANEGGMSEDQKIKTTIQRL